MNNFIINKIPDIQNKSYLELGVGNGRNFADVLASDKTSVDINGLGDFTGTTDDFFQINQRVWNVIFIDANHQFDYVLRDYNNAVSCCLEWVALHDMIPPSEKHTSPRLCGDGYKLLYHLVTETNAKVYPMDNNYGFTLVKMPAAPVFPPVEISELSYGDFLKFIGNIKLYSDAEILSLL